MKLLRYLILPCLLAAFAALPTPSRAAAEPDFVGIVADDIFALDPGKQQRAFARQRRAGITLIRRTFDWSFIEFEKGVYDFSLYDGFVGSAARQGIRVMPLLFNPPKFWSSRPKRKPIRGTYFPKNFAAMGDFGAAIAHRYGPNGSFWAENPLIPTVPITAYQVWNEPNLLVYDPPMPDPLRYVQLLEATAAGIRAADPNAEIVTAGLPDSKMSQPGDVYEYIAAMYRAGAASSFDTLAVNTYGEDAGEVLSRVERARQVMLDHGDAEARLWITEIGWSDVGPRSPQTVGRRGQAREIGKLIGALGVHRVRLNLRGFVYFAWRDGAPYSKKVGDFWGLHTGLHRRGGRAKPAFKAFKRAVAAL